MVHRAKPIERGQHPREQHRAEPTAEPVREVVEVEQVGDLMVIVLGPEQLRDVPWLQSLVEIVRAAVRGGVKSQLSGGARPDRLADRLLQRGGKRLGHRPGLAGQQRLPVVAVALIAELTQRVGERVRVGQIRERERFGEHRREIRRMIMQPVSQRTRPVSLRGRLSAPVQEVAEREHIAEVDRRVELNAGERRVGSPSSSVLIRCCARRASRRSPSVCRCARARRDTARRPSDARSVPDRTGHR